MDGLMCGCSGVVGPGSGFVLPLVVQEISNVSLLAGRYRYGSSQVDCDYAGDAAVGEERRWAAGRAYSVCGSGELAAEGLGAACLRFFAGAACGTSGAVGMAALCDFCSCGGAADFDRHGGGVYEGGASG